MFLVLDVESEKTQLNICGAERVALLPSVCLDKVPARLSWDLNVEGEISSYELGKMSEQSQSWNLLEDQFCSFALTSRDINSQITCQDPGANNTHLTCTMSGCFSVHHLWLLWGCYGDPQCNYKDCWERREDVQSIFQHQSALTNT